MKVRKERKPATTPRVRAPRDRKARETAAIALASPVATASGHTHMLSTPHEGVYSNGTGYVGIVYVAGEAKSTDAYPTMEEAAAAREAL